MRIVSVLPSATEIVCALGEQASLVGRSSECDFPESVRSVPIVMRPRVDDFERPSAAIDERVRGARARSESLYYLDLDALRSAGPDLLITQNLCSVCSVTESEAAQACEQAGICPNVLSLSPRKLEEVWESVRSIGAAIGRVEAAAALLARLRSTARPVPPGTLPARPRVGVVEWLDPPILAGLWVPEMIGAAGGVAIGPAAGEVGERTTWSEISRQRPDLLVLSPCSFSVDRTRREIAEAPTRVQLPPVSPGKGAWLADEAFFSRPGPRLANGIALLRGLLNGETPRVDMHYERWEPRGAVA